MGVAVKRVQLDGVQEGRLGTGAVLSGQVDVTQLVVRIRVRIDLG